MIELVVGLANPIPEYEKTRHNAGAWFVQALAEQCRSTLTLEKRFHGLCAQAKIGDHLVRLLIPNTYMNLSGRAVKAVSHFYRIPTESILIVHDELDLPPGIVRLKQGGGTGGHNGLKDTQACLGTANFTRLRIGIGHPGQASDVVNYVLHPPSRDDREKIDAAIAQAIAVLPTLIQGDMSRAMQDLHSCRLG